MRAASMWGWYNILFAYSWVSIGGWCVQALILWAGCVVVLVGGFGWWSGSF